MVSPEIVLDTRELEPVIISPDKLQDFLGSCRDINLGNHLEETSRRIGRFWERIKKLPNINRVLLSAIEQDGESSLYLLVAVNYGLPMSNGGLDMLLAGPEHKKLGDAQAELSYGNSEGMFEVLTELLNVEGVGVHPHEATLLPEGKYLGTLTK
ncbi:MAG: hypothetical protein Q7S79_02055 [bacterium]|nr:hypothetical protein [bacterium]